MLVYVGPTDAGTRSDRGTDGVGAPSPVLGPVTPQDLEPPATLAIDDDPGSDAESAGRNDADDPDRALRRGRYIGQIVARIERAWIRPRTSTGASMFACRVRALQDTRGSVQEIEIVRCDADVRWQTSLMRAIQSASPLPAAPDPSVFSQTLTLEFTSQPYAPGGDREGFEPESRSTSATSAR